MSHLRRIAVEVPATSANLGPGFDVFSLALEKPTDKVVLTAAPFSGIKISVSGVQSKSIPLMPDHNTAGLVAKLMIEEFELKTGLNISIKKGIWPGKGLGSSAAPAAAVAYGLNHMFNLNLPKERLIQLAAKGEVVSAGVEHADNVSAAICGGFVIIRSCSPLDIVCFKAPEDMELAVAFPNTKPPQHKTATARLMVPKTVEIEKLVRNVSNAAFMTAGFATADIDLVGKSMLDAVVEPKRASLIEGYRQVKENALKAGASGVAISGAGPALLAVIDKKKANALEVALAMKKGFSSVGLKSTAFGTRSGKGARLIEE